MRKRRRQNKEVKAQRTKKMAREAVNLNKVIAGLENNLTLTDLHKKTGLSQKNIRKIMHSSPEEITFLMMKRQPDVKKR